MKLSLPSLCLALASGFFLLPSSHAATISLSSGSFQAAARNEGLIGGDGDFIPSLLSSGSVHAEEGNSEAQASYIFDLSATGLNASITSTLTANNTPQPLSLASAFLSFRVILTESFNYSFSGTFSAVSPSPQNNAALFNVSTNTTIYSEIDTTATAILDGIAAGGNATGSPHGVIGPGTYNFTLAHAVRAGGTGSGTFNLSLTQVESATSVPDSASTAVLVGLGVIGAMAGRRRQLRA